MTVDEKNKIINTLPDNLIKYYNNNNFDDLIKELQQSIKSGNFVNKDGEELKDKGQQVFNKVLSILIIDLFKSFGASIDYNYEIPLNVKRIFDILGFDENINVFIVFFDKFIKKNGSDSYRVFDDANISILYNLWRDDVLSDNDIRGQAEDKDNSIFFNRNWFKLPVGTLRTYSAKVYKELQKDSTIRGIQNLIDNNSIPKELADYLKNKQERNEKVDLFIVRSLILTVGEDMSKFEIREENTIKQILNLMGSSDKSEEENKFEVVDKTKQDIINKFRKLTVQDRREIIKDLQQLENEYYIR